MTPFTRMRLIFLPLFLVGLYIAARVLLPGLLGIIVGLLFVAAGLSWAVVTVRRSRSHDQQPGDASRDQ